MPTSSIDIEMLLPHRGAMLLISEIISFDRQRTVTLAVVSESWPLTNEKGADPMVLIEVVAQTAAVNNGWILLQEKGPDVDRRGWIVGIKKSQLFVRTVPLGTQLETESENTFAFEGLREVRGVVRIEGQVAAEVTLQVMQAQ